MFRFWTNSFGMNAFDRENTRKYRWELGLGILLYFILVIAQGWSYHLWKIDEGPWRIAAALAPMLGVFVSVWAGWRMFGGRTIAAADPNGGRC